MEPGCITVTEAIERGTDADSGSRLLQLTSAPAIHENIYGEVPYMDPSSRYLMFIMGQRPYPHFPGEVWRADLETRRLTPVCDQVPGIRGMAVSTDRRHFYCLRNCADTPGTHGRSAAGPHEIVRTEIATLEQETYHIEGLPRVGSLGSMAPDGRTYVFSTRLDRQLFGVVRCDLQDGSWEVVHEGTEICNAHPQVEPGSGQDYLIQHNRGCQFDEKGLPSRSYGDIGATLYVIDRDGGDVRELPVGQPHTWRCQGHQCWIGTTGQILLTVNAAWPFALSAEEAQQMKSEGILLAVRPGDLQPRVVARDYLYSHPNASGDGHFFVSDTFYDSQIVVGSIKTGRTRVLCQSGASFGLPQYTHPHPYLSPDCRWVIFNSDVTGVPQVYAASVPDGLLDELDSER